MDKIITNLIDCFLKHRNDSNFGHAFISNLHIRQFSFKPTSEMLALPIFHKLDEYHASEEWTKFKYRIMHNYQPDE